MRHMISLRRLGAAIGVTTGLFYIGHTSAQEIENGVPLTITVDNLQVSVERLMIRLHGREVTISTELRNETDSPQVVGFYAYTPLFGQLGEGEEHLDKSFDDLRVLIDKRPKKVRKFYKAYFLGHDITDALVKAGLNPLPDLRADPKKLTRLPVIEGTKPTAWLGSVTYSWADSLPPWARVTQEVRYRDMPQFGLEDLASDRFSQRVLQYCGDPESIRARIKTIDSHIQQVLIERHEFAVPYMALHEVSVEVTQTDRSWLGGRPVLALVCGIRNPSLSAQISGVLNAADQSLQVMIISIMGSAANSSIHKEK
jgi:hypothetical protein